MLTFLAFLEEISALESINCQFKEAELNVCGCNLSNFSQEANVDFGCSNATNDQSDKILQSRRAK